MIKCNVRCLNCLLIHRDPQKRSTLFFTITPIFRGGLLHFLLMETGKNILQCSYLTEW